MDVMFYICAFLVVIIFIGMAGWCVIALIDEYKEKKNDLHGIRDKAIQRRREENIENNIIILRAEYTGGYRCAYININHMDDYDFVKDAVLKWLNDNNIKFKILRESDCGYIEIEFI